MGKSAYPKKFEGAEKAITATKTTVDKDISTFKSLAKALNDGGVIAGNLPRDYQKVYDMQADQIKTYHAAVSMILQYEEDLDGAGGDKKRESELKKKIKAEEKKCDVCIKTLNDLRKTYGELRKLVSAEMSKADTEFGKLDTTL